jgi:AraC-like DNA-binding protein
MNKRDFAESSKVRGLQGLEILSARWFQHSFAPHMHDFYAVALNYAGRGAFHCRRALHDATPTTCNLIAPGELHTGFPVSEDGWIYRNLYIETDLMTNLLTDLEFPKPKDVTFKSPLVNDRVLSKRLAQIFASLSTATSRLHSESELLSVVARLATHHFLPSQQLREVGREPTAVKRVREWIDAHPEQDVSVSSLANIAGLSPYYLVRVFHKHVGVPPHQYQKNVRVLRARKLLASGAPISDVACLAGFYDQSHLNRCFKTTLGITPGRYAAGA